MKKNSTCYGWRQATAWILAGLIVGLGLAGLSQAIWPAGAAYQLCSDDPCNPDEGGEPGGEGGGEADDMRPDVWA